MTQDPADKAHEAFKQHGFTAFVYFPPEADWEKVQKFFDQISMLAVEGFFSDREGWDPFVAGHTRDIMGIDCKQGHLYLSTACLHANHSYCQGKDGFCGPKTPAVCKFCAAPCLCSCHQQKQVEKQTESDTVDG